MKFLIDECLSPKLVEVATRAGHVESAHVNHRGMMGWSDSRVTRKAIDESWTLVTRNSDDFRPRAGSSSLAPCCLSEPIHPGLVCLDCPEGSNGVQQPEYFEAALDHLRAADDLVNRVLEVDPVPGAPGKVAIRVYEFPAASG